MYNAKINSQLKHYLNYVKIYEHKLFQHIIYTQSIENSNKLQMHEQNVVQNKHANYQNHIYNRFSTLKIIIINVTTCTPHLILKT